MKDQLQHATITLQESYSAPLERVFSEFADPVARARWSAPSNDELVYDEADFQIGGQDVFRCGPKGDLKFRGETHYLDIVPNARVVASQQHPFSMTLKNSIILAKIGAPFLRE